MKELLIRALLTWCIFLPVAFANGAIRDAVYKPKVGDLAAHQISTIIAIVLFVSLAYFMFRSYTATASNAQLFMAGLLMVGMTVLFEFGFGLFLRGFPLSRLLHDYNILQGRVWGVFLVAMLISPYLVKLLYKE